MKKKHPLFDLIAFNKNNFLESKFSENTLFFNNLFHKTNEINKFTKKLSNPHPVFNLNTTINFINLKINNKNFTKMNFFKKRDISFITKFNKFETLILFYFKPTYFKYLYLKFLKKNPINSLINFNYFKINSFDYNLNNNTTPDNLTPVDSFSYILKKKMLKVFNYSKFPTITSS